MLLLIWGIIIWGIKILFQYKINVIVLLIVIFLMLAPLLITISSGHIGNNCPYKEGYLECQNSYNGNEDPQGLMNCMQTYRQTCLNFTCGGPGGTQNCGLKDLAKSIVIVPFFTSPGMFVVGVPFLISLILISLQLFKVIKRKDEMILL